MTYVPTAWVDYGVPCIDAANLNNMEAGIDRAQGDVMNLYGLTAAIPASDPLLVGRLYFESDLLFRVWRDNGAGWDQVHTAAAGGVWTFIAETIVPAGPGVANVTFAAISGTYRGLALVSRARTDVVAARDEIACRPNNDGGNNYTWVWTHFWNNAHASASSFLAVPTYMIIAGADGANSRANNFDQTITYFMDYALADREKHAQAAGGGLGTWNIVTRPVYRIYTGGWASTAVITSLVLLPVAGANFVAGSRFALYGIT